MPPSELKPNPTAPSEPPAPLPPPPKGAADGPAPLQPTAAAPMPKKIVSSRYGELDHSELVHLLDSLDDDRSKSRFRESIYVSVIFYIALAWLILYGPRVLFHQGRIVPSAETMKQKDQLTQLEMNDELARLKTPKVPKVAPPPPPRAQMQAMQRASQAAKAAAASAATKPPPAPLPQAPQPQQAPPPPPVVAQPSPAPQPRPSAPTSAVPDAPKPNFNTAPQSPGQSIADAARAAAQNSRGGQPGGEPGGAGRIGQQGAAAGYEILSDTQGVDFTEYIKRILRMIKAAWYPLIPEECYPPLSKEGTTLIRFTIMANGALADPHLEDSTHDRAIDKAAWGSLNAIGQFPPLPAAFKGPSLELRLQFVISRKAYDAQ